MSEVAAHDGLILDLVRKQGTVRPVDAGQALLTAGVTTHASAADAGTYACRRLVRAGRLAKVSRGTYAVRDRDETMVCVPGPGNLSIMELRGLRAAARVFVVALSRAENRASAGLKERLVGEHRAASSLVALLDLVIKEVAP